MVLDRNRTVGVRLEPGSRRSAYLSVDGGRAFKVLSGDRVEVRRSAQVTRLVKLTGRSFYELVHQKLGKG
jgi:NAD+ kinase